MSDPRHEAAARRGTAGIAAWRRENPNGALDLTLCDMSMWDADFANADLRRANLSGAKYIRGTFDGADLTDAVLTDGTFNGTTFRFAKLVGVKFDNAKLKDCKFGMAEITNGNFTSADLTAANLDYSNLAGATFEASRLRDTKLRFAIVDGGTLLNTVYHNKGTDFSGVALANARMLPELRGQFEFYTRRNYWESWYSTHNFAVSLFVRAFWSISNYGHSTYRLIGVTVILILLLAFAFIAPTLLGFGVPICNLYPSAESNGCECNVNITGGSGFKWVSLLYFRSIYFTLSTFTTGGFGEMYPRAESVYGQVLCGVSTTAGYVLFGALLARLSNLFSYFAAPIRIVEKPKPPKQG